VLDTAPGAPDTQPAHPPPHPRGGRAVPAVRAPAAVQTAWFLADLDGFLERCARARIVAHAAQHRTLVAELRGQ